MPETKWHAYSKAWSQPEAARDAALAQLVVEGVNYTDPTISLSGRLKFSAHMAQFQKDMPGAGFEIESVREHHNQSLANWRLVAPDGAEMMRGTSHANLTDDGRFVSFTGFFGS